MIRGRSVKIIATVCGTRIRLPSGTGLILIPTMSIQSLGPDQLSTQWLSRVNLAKREAVKAPPSMPLFTVCVLPCRTSYSFLPGSYMGLSAIGCLIK